MKTSLLFLLLSAFSFSAFCNSPEPKSSLYMSSETNNDCDFSKYAPVTGKDKKCYLNKCWAEKKGIKVSKEGYKKKHYKKEDVYTWPIEDVCIPSAKEQPTLKDLEDGTFLYKYSDREFRGTPNRCRCLPGSTLIDTPSGDVAINQLKEMDLVYSISDKGEKIIVPIKITNKVQISAQHSMIVLELADGRKLQVTAEHPSSTEKKSLDQYAVGEELNGSKIITKTIVTYTEEYTYDILPDSETGTYWANGILIGSTLTTFSRIIQ